MELEDLNRLIKEMAPGAPLNLEEIPDIELYMDQVIELIEKKLSLHKRNSKDKTLTKTMINNYIKAGVLMPSRKKRYSRRHLALLLMLYNTKQVLSINDISLLFNIFNGIEEKNIEQDSRIDHIYNIFRELNREPAERLKKDSEEKLSGIKEITATMEDGKDKESLEWFLMAMSLASRAFMEKRLAEAIIDRYFKADCT